MSSTTFLLIAMFLIVDYPVSQAQPVTTEEPEYQWPATCKGKSYCHVKPISYYPTDKVEKLMENTSLVYKFGEPQTRGSEKDIASCEKRYSLKQIYLIKDKNDRIRFVPQTDKFKIYIAVEECKHPGRVTRAYRPEYLRASALDDNQIECTQTMVPFAFPVLSHDKTSLESEAPKDGISLSCSGKIIQQNKQ